MLRQKRVSWEYVRLATTWKTDGVRMGVSTGGTIPLMYFMRTNRVVEAIVSVRGVKSEVYGV